VNSSWIEPNLAWDEAVQHFVARILEPHRANRFLESFLPFAERVAELGAVNSLSQTVLKLTVPGVPDFYQGTELWDFSLVDPDNRRPVDYGLRRAQMESLGLDGAPLLEHWRDGRIKQFAIRTLLRFRQEQRVLFEAGAYEPIGATGTFSECCVAFERRLDESPRLLVVVPRLSARVGFPPVGPCWRDTQLTIPTGSSPWRDLFTGRKIGSGQIPVAELFESLPFAALAC
jgi:(1->4)-alpha-D-glucan 1-alpha-D-glucosylmutase